MLTTVTVTLEIKGKSNDAQHVVDDVLDNGNFQDAINECARDNDLAVKVKSALIESVRSKAKRRHRGGRRWSIALRSPGRTWILNLWRDTEQLAQEADPPDDDEPTPVPVLPGQGRLF